MAVIALIIIAVVWRDARGDKSTMVVALTGSEPAVGADAAFPACIRACGIFGESNCIGMCAANAAQAANSPPARLSLAGAQHTADTYFDGCVSMCQKTGGAHCLSRCMTGALHDVAGGLG